MAEKEYSDTDVRKDFDEFLKTCPPTEGGGEVAGVTAVGLVMRSEREGAFALRTADNTVHEIPTEAVEGFTVLSSSPGVRVAQLALNPEKLGPERTGALRAMAQSGGAGAIKAPFEKTPPFDTLKEGPFDTIKEQPYDTVKEQPYDTVKEQPYDTVKEQPFDTLKEVIADTLKEVGKDPLGDGGGTGIADTLVETIPGVPGGGVIQPQAAAMQAQAAPGAIGVQPIAKSAQWDTIKEGAYDTVKEQPYDTVKEQPYDTVKEQPYDTLKEVIADTLKEVGKDPLGDGGGTGIADTLVETIPGVPGGGVTQPRADMGAGVMQGAAAMPSAALAAPFTVPIADQLTIKEAIKDPMYETIKEAGKDPMFDPPGTGIWDTLVETPFPGGGTLVETPIPGGGLAAQPAAYQQQGLVPFVLATPHQAPQGALAQQYLAVQAAQGGLGLV